MPPPNLAYTQITDRNTHFNGEAPPTYFCLKEKRIKFGLSERKALHLQYD